MSDTLAPLCGALRGRPKPRLTAVVDYRDRIVSDRTSATTLLAGGLMKSWESVFSPFLGSAIAGSETFPGRRLRQISHWRAVALLLLFESMIMLQSPWVCAQSNGADANPLPEVFGKARSVQAAPSIGAVSDTIPIVVSPGRRNIQPHLALTYNSLGGLGTAGKGWSIDIGFVSRWHGDGTPTVGASDVYSYAISGAGGELRRTATGIYRAKIENVYREFRRRQDEGGSDYWVMDGGEGVRHYFGSSQNARIDGDLWMLDSVVDASGNTITYKYTSRDGIPYIDEIWYTGYTNGDLGANVVKFEYGTAPRPDTRISFANNLKSHQIVQQVQRLRLSRISVFTNRGYSLVRRYELGYVQSPMNDQSLLSRVTLVGSDDTSRITLRTSQYTARDLANSWNSAQSSIPFALANDTSASESAPGNDTGARVMDVNGDGFPDMVLQYPFDAQSGDNTNHGVYLGDGKGGFYRNDAAFSGRPFTSNSCGSPYDIKFVSESSDYRGAPVGVQLVDVNADMLPDLVVASAPLNHRREVWLNTGTAWRCDDAWTQALAAATPSRFSLVHSDYTSTGTEFVDINADGRTDIVWSEIYDGDTFDNVYLNTGSGWARNDALSTSLYEVTKGRGFVKDGENQAFTVMDVNGDGLADIVRTVDAPCSTYPEAKRVYLGTEQGWRMDQGYTNSLCAYSIISTSQGKTRTYGLMPVDFNGDGLVDFIRAKTGPGGDPGSPPVAVYAYRNTGAGWVGARSGEKRYCDVHETTDDPADYCSGSESDDPVSEQVANAVFKLGLAFATGFKYSKSTGFMFADVNGDGNSDIIRAMGGKRNLWLADSTPPDLLSRATSAVGEVTDIKWMPSSGLDNITFAGEGMPVSMPVVKEITRRDGRGNSYTTSHNYGGGLYGYYYVAPNSQLISLGRDRRFRGFAWSEQTLPSGLHALTRYYQQENLAGVSSTVEKLAGGNRTVLTRELSVYEVRSTSIGNQILLLQSDEEMIDPEGTLHSRLKYTYDDKMNVTSVYRDPEVSESGDETTTFFTWAANDGAGIWCLPARNKVVSGSNGPVLSEFFMRYDDLPERQVVNGLLSETQSLVDVWKYTFKSMKYDGYGNIVSITDGEGGSTSFEYDSTSTFRTRAVDPEGRVVQSQYDPGFGVLLRDTDASGNATIKQYDMFGRLKMVTLPGDEQSRFGTRTYQYSELGNASAQYYLIKETETPGEDGTLDTARYFDGLGRVYAVTQENAGNWILTWTDYDDADNPIATTRPYFQAQSALITHIVRDELHRPVSIQDPDGSSVRIYYAGGRTDVSDQRGNKSSFYRNFDGKITSIHRWVGTQEQVTAYGYDPLGRLIGIKDALGSTSLITYDAQDRRVKFEDPNAGIYSYQYDDAGRLIAQIDPEGSTTRFQYNKSGDLLRKDFPDGTYNEFIYGGAGDSNAAGRIIRIKDAAGVAEVFYDVRGNITERRRTVLGRKYVTGYAYDSLARIRRIIYPDGFIVDYAYDPTGNLARITDSRQRTIAEFTNHNAAGQLKDVRFGNGVSSTFDYDDLLRMISILTRNASGETQQNLLYEFDPAGNVQSITDVVRGASQHFEYDAIDRLTRATGPDGDERYEYDAIGNLLRKGGLTFSVDPACPQRLYGMGSNAEPPRVGVIGGRIAVGERSFRLNYDKRGNLVQKGSRRFAYDAENHLIRVSDRGRDSIMENIYDALGQLVIQKTRGETVVFIDGIYEEGSTYASRHVRAGALLVSTIVTPLSSVQLIAEAPPSPYGLDRSGNGHPEWLAAALASFALFAFIATPIGCRARRRSLIMVCQSVGGVKDRPCKAIFLMIFVPVFTFVNSQTAWGEIPRARESDNQSAQSGTRYYYHANHLGSINVVTDDRGVAVARHDYRPYGEPVDWTGPNGAPELRNGFNGQRYDDETNLYYFGARYYDPEIGRFLTADTQVPDPMNPKVLHRYAFAGDNPIRYVDPTGHAFWEWFLAGFVIGALIVIGIATCGIGFAVGAGSLAAIAGGVALFTLGGAALGAAAMGVYAVTQMSGSGSSDFNWKTFGTALATGAIIGAAAGAGISACPYSIGFFLPETAAGFFAGLAADFVVGAVLGGFGPVVAHLRTGGALEDILSAKLAGEMGTSALKGGLYGTITGVGLNLLGAAGKIYLNYSRAFTTLLTLEASAESLTQLRWPGHTFSFTDIFGLDPNWFRNSPPKPLSIPSWAFAGTALSYGGNSQGNAMSPLFDTMPLTR